MNTESALGAWNLNVTVLLLFTSGEIIGVPPHNACCAFSCIVANINIAKKGKNVFICTYF
jgi:hypothetical protein